MKEEKTARCIFCGFALQDGDLQKAHICMDCLRLILGIFAIILSIYAFVAGGILALSLEDVRWLLVWIIPTICVPLAVAWNQ